MILFVQPFSLGSPGGGARILRGLLGQAPLEWHSVCSSPQRPKPWPNETHLRSRPFWGKIETSRLARLPQMTTSIFASTFRRRLEELCQYRKARAIHTVPHAGFDFDYAHAVARKLSLPFFISMHDDLAYTLPDVRHENLRESAMKRAWLDASDRFVISEALGREYSQRYGTREYQIVTDGVSELAPCQNTRASNSLRIYFMGLFHMAYEENLSALLDGITAFENTHPGTAVTVTCRCEHIRSQVLQGRKQVRVLPFASEAQIARDLENADLVYMPIPFGKEHENFARYSVSTKMITYAASGVPILYHGPTHSAAFELLHRHDAAIFMPTVAFLDIAQALGELSDSECKRVAANALQVAVRDFMLADQMQKFWGKISTFVP